MTNEIALGAAQAEDLARKGQDLRHLIQCLTPIQTDCAQHLIIHR